MPRGVALSSSTADEASPANPMELPAASEVWKEIIRGHSSHTRDDNIIHLVDSHGHAHLERESEPLYRLDTDHNEPPERHFISLSCAVEPTDWEACIQYAAKSRHRLAALGVHPWYLAELPKDWLGDLEALLQQHTGILVGEIGLCKVARFIRTYRQGKAAALALQRTVFSQQLDLAAAYRRPVTVHCVQQQQVLLDTLKERHSRQQLPTAIALHSFTGTAHHVDQLMKWERSLYSRRRSIEKDEATNEPLLYFGFSHMVNCAMCSSEKSRRQGREAIRQVPPERLLVESDVHNSHDSMGGTALACAYLARALDEPVDVVAQRTTANALRFLQTIRHGTTERQEV